MTTAQAGPTRRVWLILASAMAMPAAIYGFLIQFAFAGEPPAATTATPLARALFWGAAVAFLVASMLWTQLRVRAPINEATCMQPPAPLFAPSEFQLRSVVSLALAEAVCSLGFVQAIVYRGAVRDYLPFGAATVLVIVLDIIPTGLRYWNSREA
jgi:hypothetical protein